MLTPKKETQQVNEDLLWNEVLRFTHCGHALQSIDLLTHLMAENQKRDGSPHDEDWDSFYHVIRLLTSIAKFDKEKLPD